MLDTCWLLGLENATGFVPWQPQVLSHYDEHRPAWKAEKTTCDWLRAGLWIFGCLQTCLDPLHNFEAKKIVILTLRSDFLQHIQFSLFMFVPCFLYLDLWPSICAHWNCVLPHNCLVVFSIFGWGLNGVSVDIPWQKFPMSNGWDSYGILPNKNRIK